jgi:hypothetical protein
MPAQVNAPKGICTLAILTGGEVTLADAVAAMLIETRHQGISTWKARAQMWKGFLDLLAGSASAYSQTIYLAMPGLAAESAAEAVPSDALARARSHQFLSWELRCATSLAALKRRQGQAPATRDSSCLYTNVSWKAWIAANLRLRVR